MAIHINDEEADWLLREFARKRKLKLTDALKAAIQEATRLENQKVQEFQARVQPVIDRARIRKSEERGRLATD
ncbi:MAG: type II toxin-antitoxin system VapB family antitoxin [Neoaquamicrobium sediminum]|uniref:type II toxin-antitoxin system VapB family antitoxin n=1 Tax=Neoaquamicrobium sediminum TaxID=1849104 RepID=UPI00403568F8